jgi:acetyl esterase/lipase
MLSKTTHIYAQSESGPLQLVVYLPQNRNTIKTCDPAFMYFHGGGLVAFNREFIPTHIVQSCVQRNWPLISVDYNLLPQARGKSLLSNIRDSYRFVRENLSSIIGKGDALWEKVIVGGNSAGIITFTYLCYIYLY